MAVLCIISSWIKHLNIAHACKAPLTTKTAHATIKKIFLFLYFCIFQPEIVSVSQFAAGAHLGHQVLYDELIYFVKEVSSQETVGLQFLLCRVKVQDEVRHMKRYWQEQRLETSYKPHIAV